MTGEDRGDPGGPGRLLGPGLTGRLERWAAAARVDEAARARARAHWLHRAALEDATLTGVLVELAEQCRTVVATTTSGRAHRARVQAVGADFVALRLERTAALVLVRHSAVAAVRTLGTDAVVGEERVRTGVDLRSVLCGLAEQRSAVELVTGSTAVGGFLAWVGGDVAALRPDAGAPDESTTYVSLDAVDEVHIA